MMKEFSSKLFAHGKALGLSEMEVYINKKSKLKIASFNKKIDKYDIADEVGLSFRAISNGKMGYAYTENINEEVIDRLVKEVIENASIIEKDDVDTIFEGSSEYMQPQTKENKLDNVSEEEKIDFVLKLEEEALSLDDRITMVGMSQYIEEINDIEIFNSKGLELKNRQNKAYVYLSTTAKQGEDIKTGIAYQVATDFSEFDYKKLAKEGVKDAVDKLSAEQIASGKYKVAFKNEVMCDLLDSYSEIFSAQKVHEGMSLLKDKIGTLVACSELSIIDDPFAKDSVVNRNFDDEGVATKPKKLVDCGMLKTYLHNIATAKKDDVESTGNGFKPTFKSVVKIAPTNMYIQKGEISFENMLKKMGKGVLITDVQGLHAGLDAVTGDFSLSCNGFYIEDGKIQKVVNTITVAGNFFDMLKDIEEICSDFKFSIPSTNTCFGSPSLLVKELTISGK
ncbi:TldD/PmbA family protein [Clostridiaceae bacterium M8S5]|nr:TldD/PmbA family protein [Clostridiaceae bacterium M8S5]